MRPGIFISGQSINPSVGQSVHGSNFLKNERKIDIYNQTWVIKQSFNQFKLHEYALVLCTLLGEKTIFLHLIIKNRSSRASNISSWGSNISSWGSNISIWGSNISNWGSNISSCGSNISSWYSNVPNWGSNVPSLGSSMPGWGLNVLSWGWHKLSWG